MAGAELPEMEELLRIVDAAGARIEVRSLCEAHDAGRRWPVIAIAAQVARWLRRS